MSSLFFTLKSFNGCCCCCCFCVAVVVVIVLLLSHPYLFKKTYISFLCSILSETINTNFNLITSHQCCVCHIYLVIKPPRNTGIVFCIIFSSFKNVFFFFRFTTKIIPSFVDISLLGDLRQFGSKVIFYIQFFFRDLIRMKIQGAVSEEDYYLICRSDRINVM